MDDKISECYRQDAITDHTWDTFLIEIGKKTQNFRKSLVSDDVCLSLVSDKSTLDMETKNIIDRDIMYQGFLEMVENMKEKV